MSAQVTHSAPRRRQKALKTTRMMATAGLASLLAGLFFIWIGPTGIEGGFYWFTAMVVIGITTLLLAPVVYFSYMEALEPEIYSPAHATWHLADDE